VDDYSKTAVKPQILYLYRFAIPGGVTTQLSNRLKTMLSWSTPHFGFFSDYGGRSVFGSYPHSAIFSPLDQLAEYLRHHAIDLIVVIDSPEAYPIIQQVGYSGPILNEVHTTKNLQYLTLLRDNPPMTALATPSHYLQERILDELGYRNLRPVYVIPNGVDTTLFVPAPINAVFTRPIAAWIGKLNDHKNWRALLTVMTQLCSQMDFDIWLIGGYTASDKVQRDVIQQLDLAGLIDRVQWIPHVTYHNMPFVYSSVAESGGFCLSTSTNESFGLTILEAMACGCPTIAPAVGAIPELLCDDLQQCLYEPGSTTSALVTMRKVYDDSELRQRLIRTGIAAARTRYEMTRVNAIYQKMVTTLL
jgi:glycosyltransferase involved in cell wall biosynthesis